MNRILVFGGTFDPPHLAHVEIPKKAMDFLNCEHILYIPAYQSPLKDEPATAASHRLAMLHLALQNAPWATISTIEIEAKGTNYTIDTLEKLHQKYDEMQLLIGADQWNQFEQWHRHEDILRIANPAIMPRDGFGISDKRLLPIEPFQCSSKTVRSLIKQKNATNQFLSPAVTEYITTHNLYM